MVCGGVYIQGLATLRVPQVRKRHFLRHLHLTTLILPRQARDKHRESTQHKMPFSLGRNVARVPQLANEANARNVDAVRKTAFLPHLFSEC
jgi:hypothetical protein